MKLPFSGIIISIQPRIRLTRSFDERSHSYLGYMLTLEGKINEESKIFTVSLGKGAQDKHPFTNGLIISGEAQEPQDKRIEPAEYYKVSKLKVEAPKDKEENKPPPWHGLPLPLEVYRQRGHRRLDARTYSSSCNTCIWGCRMAVEMIIDHWNPRNKRYRSETFCYGPKSCQLYKAGPNRKVPGRKGMSYTEEDWVDEDAVSHRGPDE